MSAAKKWRSSKKVTVDGNAFKRARLAFKSQDEVLQGDYGHGSQEWLAEKARISPRTVNALETGQATLKTVDAVSRVLNIKGRNYIQGYGEDFTTLSANGVIDFRSSISGRVPGNEIAYLNEAFLVTLLPVVVLVDDDFIDIAKLKSMSLKLSVGELDINFIWIYKVMLNGRAQTWLGDEEDVSDVLIRTREPYQESIMFRQTSLSPLSWKDFIDHVKETEDGRILLTVNLKFEHFNKQEHIIVSVEETKVLFEKSYPEGYPYWVEPKALMI